MLIAWLRNSRHSMLLEAMDPSKEKWGELCCICLSSCLYTVKILLSVTTFLLGQVEVGWLLLKAQYKLGH